MSDFRSNLPLGTQDPAVLRANAGNLDETVNNPVPGTWTDRFGTERKNMAAIEQSAPLASAAADRAKLEADRAKSEADLAANAATAAALNIGTYYPTISAGRAAVADGDSFWVEPNSTDGLNRFTLFTRTSATTQAEKFIPAVRQDIENILSVPGKNLLDKSRIVAGSYVSPIAGGIVASSAWRRSSYIPVLPGVAYIVSGVSANGLGVGWFANDGDATPVDITLSNVGIAPDGANYAVVNITNTGQGDTSFDGTAQFEVGTVATTYEPYVNLIPSRLLADNFVPRDEFLVSSSHNMLDPAAVDYVRRYSTGNRGFVIDSLAIAASDWIPVTEGEWYTLSGTARYGESPVASQGGYFANYGELNAIDNITFVAPVAGDGAAFQVPLGMGITHVVVSLKKSNGALDGIAQLEAGEMATAYQPYELIHKIRPELLPDSPPPTPGVNFNDAAWFEYTRAEGVSQGHRFPKFRRHWILKDKDLCVVNTGTSLTARSIEHCTAHPDAAFRPPLMHSHNLASILWDKMVWEGQQYRRYDSGFFTETGSGWMTSSNLPEWDDGPYRNGLTRYTDDPGAAVSFVVPERAWQFNFIHRTDSTGVEVATVRIDEGNGQMQVWDAASAAWIEANGYQFSMREPVPVTRVVSVPSPATDVFSDVTLTSKGNTTYQKRLRMRCIDRVVQKTVTISVASAGRFMYWGVEWSPRQYMITYVNAARGSHNTQATGDRGLPRYQDNEIWSFRPDLLLFELPIHNDGAAAAGSYAAGYWGRLTNNFVFRSDYELSLQSRGQYFGLAPEIGMFTSSISWNFGGIEDDGSLKFGAEIGTGKMMTALDKFSEAAVWVWENHPDVPCINAAARWCEAGFAIFGDLRSATVGSGKDGPTFTNEGSHWNDTGSTIIAKTVLPLLDFTSGK